MTYALLIALALIVGIVTGLRWYLRWRGSSTSEPLHTIVDRRADFSQVTHLMDCNACTPEPGQDFVDGLLINCPEEITYSTKQTRLDRRDSPFRVCALARFRHGTPGISTPFSPYEVTFTLINAATKVAHSGMMLRRHTPLPEPGRASRPMADESAWADLVITSYFNPDLADIADVPAEDADYDLFASIGSFRSNVLHVRVRRRGGTLP
jgi:hypothetical protein